MLVTFEFDSNGFDIKLRQCIGVGELIVIDYKREVREYKGQSAPLAIRTYVIDI